MVVWHLGYGLHEMDLLEAQVVLAAGGVYVCFRRPEQKLKDLQEGAELAPAYLDVA